VKPERAGLTGRAALGRARYMSRDAGGVKQKESEDEKEASERRAV